MADSGNLRPVTVRSETTRVCADASGQTPNGAMTRNADRARPIDTALRMMPSARGRVTCTASAAGARGRALDQLLRPRLDPGKEAGHDDADAHAGVALDVRGADEHPGRAPRLDDLRQRAVDGPLDL